MLYTVLQAQESASDYVFVGFSLNHFAEMVVWVFEIVTLLLSPSTVFATLGKRNTGITSSQRSERFITFEIPGDCGAAL